MNFTLRFESIPSIYLYLYYLSMQYHFALESRLPYVHSTFNVLKYLEDVPREFFFCHIVTARDAGHQVQEGLHLQLGQVNYNPELIHIHMRVPSLPRAGLRFSFPSLLIIFNLLSYVLPFQRITWICITRGASNIQESYGRNSPF